LLLDSGDDDFSFSVKNLSRFRVNTYKQRGSLAAIVRVISFELPVYTELNIPENVMSIADFNNGFVLVTGPAASGKSTTLACIVDAVNSTRDGHIITLEDPIEYLHKHKKSVVSQREVPMDTPSYVVALMAALRQSPDMILIGEMRDSDTIRTAVTAAETGHFVISTLHTIGAANTIDRIIDAFPEQQQQQIRVQLSMVLRAVVSQQLIPTVDGKVVPAFEVMFINSAIRNMIRESKIHQIDSAIFSSGDENMISMDTSIYNLYKGGRITAENALLYSINKELMQKKINANV
jgi:twitching motility protein PilT